MNEPLSNPNPQKINVDGATVEQSQVAQAGGNIAQYSGIITFNQTEIIQSSIEDITSKEFIHASPYKGLQRFDTEDKDLFFGRDQFLTGLVNELEQTNLILLLGASGSGKSSVIRAGLIPWLSKKMGSHFVKLVLTPDRDPFESFYASLLSKYKQSDAKIARKVKADTLTEVISQLKKPDEYWLILLDQFEELFTTSLSDQRNLFIKSLVQLNTTQQNSVKVIATMRADFLDKLSPYPKLVKATDKHRPLIAEMQRDELRLAIEQPAAHHGVVFEPELVPEILNDIKGQAGYLPLLQYTLNLLWETEVEQGLSQDRTLNLETYHQIGGVHGALQQHVDAIYEALSPDEQRATQRIFLKLVDIGEDAASGGQWKPVRRRASKALFNDELEQGVLAKLIDEKLLVSDCSLDSHESTIDIAHEILLNSWVTLNKWIQENRKAIAIRNRLNNDLNLWKSQKSDTELWSGAKLEQVLELRIDPIFNQVLGGFSPDENEFIDLSRGLRDRQRRRTLIALSSFSAFALMLAGLAGWHWRESEISKQEIRVRHSQLLLNQGQKFDALIEILQAAAPFHHSLSKPSIDIWRTLIEAIYAKKEYKRLEGHKGLVESIAFSPDGNILASASSDNTIKLWDMQTGQEIQTLTGHQDPVKSIAFSPDGNILASGSDDQTIKLWDMQTGQEIQTLTGHQAEIASIAFSPDGNILASGSFDNKIKLWNLQTGKEIQTLTGHQHWVSTIAFSPDGNILASGSGDNKIKLWNVQTGKEIQTLTGHQNWVVSITFSPDGNILASGSGDKTIKLWNVQTQTEIYTLTGHQDWVRSIAFSPDGNILASGSGDKTIKLWNVQAKTEIYTLTGHQDWVRSIAFSPDGNILASGSSDKSIKLWNLQSGTETQILTGHQDTVWSIAFSPDGNILASGSSDKSIKLWNMQTGKEIKTLSGHQDKVRSIAFHPNGNILASGSDEETIKLWNVQTGTEIQTLSGPPGWPWSMAFSPDGNILASSSDQSIKLWDVQTETEILTLSGYQDYIRSIAFSPDGNILASGSLDKTIKLWNVQTGKEIQTLSGHLGIIWGLAFSPDGITLASGSSDNTIKLWNVQTGKEIKTLRGPQNSVRSIALNPKGNILASGSDDQKIKLWNLETGQEILTLTTDPHIVRSIAFTPDGKYLAFTRQNTITVQYINTVENTDIDELIKKGCDQVHHYLKFSPNVREKDRNICDGIATHQ